MYKVAELLNKVTAEAINTPNDRCLTDATFEHSSITNDLLELKQVLREYIVNYSHIISVITYLGRGNQQSKANLVMGVPKEAIKNLTIHTTDSGHLTIIRTLVSQFIEYNKVLINNFEKLSIFSGYTMIARGDYFHPVNTFNNKIRDAKYISSSIKE